MASRSDRLIVPFCLVLVRLPLESYAWGPQYRKDIVMLKQVE